MTTAGRATFITARGGRGKNEGNLAVLSKQYSVRDMPAHKNLKVRQPGQDTKEEVKVSLQKEAEEKILYTNVLNIELPESIKEMDADNNFDESVTIFQDDGVNDESEEDNEEEDDDDTEQLLAELRKIKQERAEEKLKKENQLKSDAAHRNEHSEFANPGVVLGDEFTVKKRWDDDVVFKNCNNGVNDRKRKTFINDTLRSEFHKKFMDKYVK